MQTSRQPRRSRNGSVRSRGRRLRRTGRAAAALAVVLAVAGAAACGDSGNTAKQSAPTSTTTTLPVLSEAQLTATLLTVADLPPGWTVESDASTTTTAASGSKDATAFLCPAASAPLKKEEHAKASASFSQSETGPFLLQNLTSAPDADQHFDDLKRVLRSCVGTPWTSNSDGMSMDLKMADVSAAKVGDEVAAVRITGTESSAQVTLTADFVLVRQGTVIELYAGMNVQSPLLHTTQMTPAEFASVVATGNKKVVQQLGG